MNTKYQDLFYMKPHAITPRGMFMSKATKSRPNLPRKATYLYFLREPFMKYSKRQVNIKEVFIFRRNYTSFTKISIFVCLFSICAAMVL